MASGDEGFLKLHIDEDVVNESQSQYSIPVPTGNTRTKVSFYQELVKLHTDSHDTLVARPTPNDSHDDVSSVKGHTGTDRNNFREKLTISCDAFPPSSLELPGKGRKPSCLADLPKRIRTLIWKYLDFSSLKCLSEVHPKFLAEIEGLPMLTSGLQSNHCTLHTLLRMIPDLPLYEYLDETSIRNLRLVCKDFQTTVAAWASITVYSKSRWDAQTGCTTAGTNKDFGFIETHEHYIPDISSKASSPDRIVKTTIFDIYTQVIQFFPNEKLTILLPCLRNYKALKSSCDLCVCHKDLKNILTYVDGEDLMNLELVNKTFQRIVWEFINYSCASCQKQTNLFHLMDLPSEIHEKILNLCGTKERANLRLVSKLMQYQVDTLAGVQIYLNDMKWKWNSNCGKLPPAYSLIITNVENIHSVMFFISDYNCNLLTRLVVDGQFLSNAMLCVLENCRNLRYLGFTFALQMTSIEDEVRKSFPVKRLPIKLNGLKALDLKIKDRALSENNLLRVQSWTWTNAFEFMKPNLFLMPKLTSFSLCEESIFSHNLLNEVAEKVLKFLIGHRSTLKYVQVTLLGHCSRACNCPSYNLPLHENVLSELRLYKYCHDCDWRISRPFTTILSAQCSLRELSIYKLLDWEFYAGIIMKNQCTLRSVTIEQYFVPVIDLSAFSDCSQLQYLRISRYFDQTNSVMDSPANVFLRASHQLTNLHMLPISIKELYIVNQAVEHIMTIPNRLKNLETLEISYLGHWTDENETTEFVLKALFELRQLNCLLVEDVCVYDSGIFSYPFKEALTQINLIPAECSEIVVNQGGGRLRAVLLAERQPSLDFMPELQDRVNFYVKSVTKYLTYAHQVTGREAYVIDIADELYGDYMDDEEADDSYAEVDGLDMLQI